MLGKQWINRYLRNCGGSVTDKSRDIQRKLDGFEKWHLHLAIESLPALLPVALLLLGCALSRYLWTINRTIAGVTIAMVLFGVTQQHSIITVPTRRLPPFLPGPSSNASQVVTSHLLARCDLSLYPSPPSKTSNKSPVFFVREFAVW